MFFNHFLYSCYLSTVENEWYLSSVIIGVGAVDEATANIDTEMRIHEAVGKLMHGRTSNVVAHRLSTIRNADKVLVMHRRRTGEKARHEEVLQQQEIYHRLHRLQYSES